MKIFFRRIVLLFFMISAAGFSSAAPLLSSRAKISLLTIYPGDELFSAFGHSVFWIYDPATQTDMIYSYGTYDFEQPNFYLNFVRGHLNYLLSTYSMEEQYYSAKYEGRKIVRQELELDSALSQKLHDFLEWNALTENRYYLYDFYLDNCSSRLRDVLLKVAGNTIVFDPTVQSSYSFRQWMNQFLGSHPLSALGMNIGLGAPADKVADYMTQMYLPINLQLAFTHAKISGHPLVRSETTILDAPDRKTQQSSAIWLVLLSILTISVLATYFNVNQRLIVVLFDTTLFILPILLGSVLALLWFATDHWVCAWNTDLLWANPFCLVYLLLLNSKKRPNWLTLLCGALSALALAYMTLGYFLPEKPILILFPLILAIQIRVAHRLVTKLITTKPSL